MKDLKTFYESHTGKTSDKWESYFPVYDRIFSPYRDRNLSLLEIGIQNGGSLDIWAKYFANASKIIGCDIDPSCGKLRFSDNRISVLIGDIISSSIFRKIESLSQKFEIIIDDGSHNSDDIIRAFLLYFPFVSPGGNVRS
jgi:cephalosporin hydroxylase